MKIILLTWIALWFLPKAYDHQNPKATKCSVAFAISNAGIDVTGKFDDVHAEVTFNENMLRESYIIAKARAQSVHTGISIRDKHLRRSDYFDVEKFPEIVVESNTFKRTGVHKYIGRFLVTIKGTGKVIAVPFIVEHQGALMTLSGHFEINRLDFGLGEESAILDETVRIDVVMRVGD